ncbi:radical SAM protein, partial [Candidatus Calescamantes bacterium]|nr:radical SAM protein [Candidatus Calescamantes bacterium]
EKILTEAKYLGAKYLHISGGEPLLYKQLLELVKIGKDIGYHVNLNTNGYILTSNCINNLSEYKLDSITISLYSHNIKIHNRIKNINDDNSNLRTTMILLKKSSIDLYLQTIMTNYNIRVFDVFLQYISQFKPEILFISFLEGLHRYINRFEPSIEDINYFIADVLPRCINFINNTNKEKQSKSRKLQMKKIAKNLILLKSGKGGDYPCKYNRTMCIILANGDVHSCSAIEYYHYPTIGNLLKNNLSDLLRTDKWQRIRAKCPGWCKHCPMKYHVNLPFNEGKKNNLVD